MMITSIYIYLVVIADNVEALHDLAVIRNGYLYCAST